MGKLLGAASLIVIGAGASAGAFYLSDMFSFDSTLPEKLDDFEKEDVLEGCVQGLFPSLKDMKISGTAAGSSNEIKADFLGSNSSDKVDGCLVVNWNKDYFEGDKGKGNFRLLGTARNSDTKGFVVFAVANPTSNKKFKGAGAAYTIEKNKDEGKAVKKLEIEPKDKGKEVDFKDKFPTPKLIKKTNWGFLNEEKDMDKVCGNEDGKDDKKKKSAFFEGYGSWKGNENGKGKLGEGTDRLNAWWKDLFGDDKWKMEEVVKDMKGEWTEKVGSGIEKTE